ncbi:fimbrial biogenesis chaperone [Roseicella frigidaeris]|nr:fimbria/pilus periplasmic chaperone [Roseicella frigidaeris]
MVRKLIPILAGAALAMLAALPGGPARAASIEVAPVVIALAPDQRSAVVTLTNRSGEPTAAQLRAFAWRQSATQEELAPTEELLVSPPVFRLAPGASQVVRLVLRPAAAAAERSFRLLVDELPPPIPGATGVRMALRLSLPVFAPPPAAPPAALAWRLSPEGRLSVTNTGQRHERLTELRLTAADGSVIPLQAPATPYVLAGAERHWVLARAQRPGQAMRLAGRATGGSFEVTLGPAPR